MTCFSFQNNALQPIAQALTLQNDKHPPNSLRVQTPTVKANTNQIHLNEKETTPNHTEILKIMRNKSNSHR